MKPIHLLMLYVTFLTISAGSVAVIAAQHDRWGAVFITAIVYFAILSCGFKVKTK